MSYTKTIDAILEAHGKSIHDYLAEKGGSLDEPLLTRKECANYMGVCTKTVDRWIKKGVLPSVKLGLRRIRIRKADAEGMIAKWN